MRVTTASLWLAPAFATISLLVATDASVAAQESRIRLEGSGDDVTDAIELEAGLLLVGAAHRGSSNFMVQLQSLDGGPDEYVVNVIGEYAGTLLLPVEAGRHRFDVRADGPWVLMCEPASGEGSALPISESRSGDTPLGPLALEAGLVTATLSHDGESNFMVAIYHADGRLDGYLVNEVGAYEGRVSHRVQEAGLYWIEIRADGDWSFAMER